MASALAQMQKIEEPHKSSGRKRGVMRCLNSNCKHVFIVDAGDSMARCPECKNAPCGHVRKGNEKSWTLKKAKQIASVLRG